jgi:hypothetical protein
MNDILLNDPVLFLNFACSCLTSYKQVLIDSCWHISYLAKARVQICKPCNEPRNQFLAWQAGTSTLFDVPARQDIGWRIRFLRIDSWAP